MPAQPVPSHSAETSDDPARFPPTDEQGRRAKGGRPGGPGGAPAVTPVRIRRALGWLLGLACVVGAAAPTVALAQETAPQPPPPPQVEAPGPPPNPGAVWIAGRWMWRDGTWVWQPGRWETPAPGQAWVPGRWKKTDRGWVWEPGRWRR